MKRCRDVTDRETFRLTASFRIFDESLLHDPDRLGRVMERIHTKCDEVEALRLLREYKVDPGCWKIHISSYRGPLTILQRLPGENWVCIY